MSTAVSCCSCDESSNMVHNTYVNYPELYD